jgi:signal transduction histidine kinase/ActR/RegA family two-component response regulator
MGLIGIKHIDDGMALAIGRRSHLSLSRLAAVLEATPDFVGIGNPDGGLFFINEAGREMIGLGRSAEFSSIAMRDYQPGWACRIISNEGIPTVLQAGVWSGETALLGADGREIPVSQVIIAHRNDLGEIEYISTIMRDITERKRAEMIQVRLRRQAALRADVIMAMSERNLPLSRILQRCAEAMTQHLDAAFVRIWRHDAGGQLLELQASAGIHTGIGGPHARIPTGKFEIGMIAEELTKDLLNDSHIGAGERTNREGIAGFAGYPLVVEGRLNGVMAVFALHPLEDDTLDELASIAEAISRGIERRKVEEELVESLDREKAARLEAEELSRLKDEFLAMVSHELRAPLTSILGWAQMLRNGSLDRTSAERALQTIERNIKTQAHLVGDLLDASRIATGKLQLEVRPVDLMSLVETTVDAVRPMVEEKRLRLQMILEPWVGPFYGDLERLKQILWNLLNNAIEVRLERLENKALLIISDTGQGIDPGFLPYVFDRFRQASDSSKRGQDRHNGLGLGLAIVKHLVELHGGAIYAYSGGDGRGTDFMITLPLAVSQQVDQSIIHRYVPVVAGDERSPALNGLRVLVVDDEYDTREVLSTMLIRYGAGVRTAGSVAEALDVLIEWRPDVLVSDIGMPISDGYDLIGKLRALPEEQGGNIPAIALTAYAGNPDRQRALSSGFQMYLAKPIEPSELARVIARAAGRSENAMANEK